MHTPMHTPWVQAIDLGLSGLVEAQLGLPLDKQLQCSAWGKVLLGTAGTADTQQQAAHLNSIGTLADQSPPLSCWCCFPLAAAAAVRGAAAVRSSRRRMPAGSAGQPCGGGGAAR
jgi:hypothetical protein